MTVQLYFIRDEQPVSVSRTVPASPDTLRAALTALLAGPAEAEQAAGLTSWFSSATAGALRSAHEVDGMAVVDFRDFSSRIPSASSSLGSMLLLGSLNATVLDNSQADSIEYRFDGSCEAFGEFVQRGCIRYSR